jgi:hypothetical protein
MTAMKILQQAILPISVSLRIILAATGFILLLGTIWFIQATFSSISGAVEFFAGLLSLIVFLLPLRTSQTGSFIWVWFGSCIFSNLNFVISVYTVFALAAPTGTMVWAVTNAASVTLLFLLGRVTRGTE